MSGQTSVEAFFGQERSVQSTRIGRRKGCPITATGEALDEDAWSREEMELMLSGHE